MNIGEVAAAARVSAKMIRYYEETGLIRTVPRGQSGYGASTETEIQSLRFARRSRDPGFTVKQI